MLNAYPARGVIASRAAGGIAPAYASPGVDGDLAPRAARDPPQHQGAESDTPQ
jgi:hypothetical protein